MPRPSTEWRAALAEKVRGAPRPGEAALRALSDFYVDSNLELAREQALREGLSLPEVRELTHFGLLVMATQRVADVEELIGRTLSEEERDGLAALMRNANDDFKKEMRARVARGADEPARWELIRTTEAGYRKELEAITGLTDALLDDLLAGNVLLPGAPATTPLPTGPAPEAPRDTIAAPVKSTSPGK
jgi:hypothetical protein